MATTFSIGEFSRASGIPAKTLRFYHEKGIIIPASIDQESGYRYYDHRSLERAQVIVALRKLDFSLEDILKILAEGQDDEDILVHLERRKSAIGEEIKRHRNMISTIDTIIATERESRRVMSESPFEVEERTSWKLLVAGIRVRGRYQDCGATFGLLGRKLGRYICGRPMCLYYDDEYREDDANFEPCFPVKQNLKGEGIEIHELAPIPILRLRHAGPYDELGRSYAKLIAYADRNGYKLAVPSREIFIKGPGMIFKGRSKNYLTGIEMPMD